MRRALVTVVLLLAVGAPATAQQFDLGVEVDGYRRFLIYPHLQKGHESLQRGDHRRAIAEFERARELAPENAVVAVYLADAYAAGGDRVRADALLTRQLTRTPNDHRLTDALKKLRAPAGVAMRAPARDAGRSVAAPTAPAVAPPPPPSAGRRASASVRVSPPRRANVSADAATGAAPPPPEPVDPNAVHRTGFDAALGEGRTADAAVHAASLLDSSSTPALLDELSFRLMHAGGSNEALALLTAGYPYRAGSPAERERLLGRLLMLLPQVSGPLGEATLGLVRTPLDQPPLRSQQSVFWAGRQECTVVSALLGDMSPAYGHDDFVRLGDCLKGTDPGRARDAYARAHATQPGGAGTRSLAYAASGGGDHAAAVEAWRAVPVASLAAGELEAATAAALAAGDRAQANVWLRSWGTRGGEAQYAFWAASADAAHGHDANAEAEALRRGMQLRPNADDGVRLARLESDPRLRLQQLEAAAALDPRRADVQREIGYTYQRAGREAEALQAFERAARLEPENADAHLQVAYGHWNAGRADAAATAFGRAWALRPDVASADGLVYAHERLGHAREARRFAAQAIAIGSGQSSVGAADAGRAPAPEVASDRTSLEREFGLRRLHEDLGRRMTLSLDGYSGTRAGTGASLVRDGRINSSYSQVELDYRLGSNPVRAGRTLSAYARVMAEGGADSMVPSEYPTLGAGLRWKPFRRQVIYVAGEYQTDLDDRNVQDLLLRVSASLFNGGRFSDDWHPSGRGWFSQNLYLDGAHYVDADRTAATADYRASVHAKIASASTVEPYAHVQVNALRVASVEEDSRVGAGLRWNLWYGASRYNAPAHKLSVGVEFQQAIETYLPETRGVYLTLGARW